MGVRRRPADPVDFENQMRQSNDLTDEQKAEERKKLNLAIKKLEDYHNQGLDIQELLELSPGGYAMSGGIRKAADVVGKQWGCEIGDELARKIVEFATEFTSSQWYELEELCMKHEYCPEFGLIKRLFPLGIQERNKLLKKAIIGKWKKTDLDAEIEKMKSTDELKDKNKRGRYPKAARSMQSLTGEAIVDARKWTRVVDVLGRKENKEAFDLSSGQKKDLKALVKLLREISQWTD